jgi:hypothetical protein
LADELLIHGATGGKKLHLARWCSRLWQDRASCSDPDAEHVWIDFWMELER